MEDIVILPREVRSPHYLKTFKAFADAISSYVQ